MFSWRFKIEISIIPPQMDLSEKFWKTMKMLGLGCDNPDPSFRWIMIEFWHFDKSDSFLAPGIWRCCEEPERVWRHCWDKTSRYSDSSNTTTTTGSSSPHQRQSHGPFYPHLTISQVKKKYKKSIWYLSRSPELPVFLCFSSLPPVPLPRDPARSGNDLRSATTIVKLKSQSQRSPKDYWIPMTLITIKALLAVSDNNKFLFSI